MADPFLVEPEDRLMIVTGPNVHRKPIISCIVHDANESIERNTPDYSASR